jgi:hypothetical protein
VVGWGWKTLQGAWQVMAVEEARVKIAVSTSKDQHKMMLTINISPSFLVCHWRLKYTRGSGDQMGWRLAVGQEADDARGEGTRGESTSCVDKNLS